MGYAQFGAPDGFVVVNAHGGLACRLDVAAAGDAATAGCSAGRIALQRESPTPH